MLLETLMEKIERVLVVKFDCEYEDIKDEYFFGIHSVSGHRRNEKIAIFCAVFLFSKKADD